MNPPKVNDRLPAADLERDAAEAGVTSDEMAHPELGPGTEPGDSHLPASEAEALASTDEGERILERGLTRLPPG